MAAQLLLNDKILFEDGSIVQIRIWSVPTSVLPATHGYKYSLFYGRSGARLVGFDNERGKGDHKHVLDVETPYTFASTVRLLEDFRHEVEMIKGASI